MYGEMSTAGTRTPRRVKSKGGSVESALPFQFLLSGVTVLGGGMWSYRPPCSSYTTTRGGEVRTAGIFQNTFNTLGVRDSPSSTMWARGLSLAQKTIFVGSA